MSTRTQAKPYVGVDAVVELTPILGGATITLKNSKYKLSPSNKIAEAPNTTDGMVRSPGLSDYSGTIEGHTDVTNANTPVEVSCVPGVIYDFKLYRSKTANTYWAGTLIIGEDLDITTGVDQTEDWTFSFAKAYGNLTSPGGAIVA